MNFLNSVRITKLMYGIKQSPDFYKPGLCPVKKFLSLHYDKASFEKYSVFFLILSNRDHGEELPAEVHVRGNEQRESLGLRCHPFQGCFL